MANILLADDDASMLEFLAIALKKAGHSVTQSINGIKALNALNSGDKFDLLLTDIVMPEMDGAELAKKAREICPDIKIMFITGFTAIAAKYRNNNQSNATLLSKPFHLNDLVDQVEQLLKNPHI